ncbi:hypothetical protein BaRGS_00013887 [Batillaria attramentaria]|uniref:Uncharacterized protein n=1 Tax=Batillaria attramentaria TaxID=370345 RepID=A0ABD0L5V1_9CAEN
MRLGKRPMPPPVIPNWPRDNTAEAASGNTKRRPTGTVTPDGETQGGGAVFFVSAHLPLAPQAVHWSVQQAGGKADWQRVAAAVLGKPTDRSLGEKLVRCLLLRMPATLAAFKSSRVGLWRRRGVLQEVLLQCSDNVPASPTQRAIPGGLAEGYERAMLSWSPK